MLKETCKKVLGIKPPIIYDFGLLNMMFLIKACKMHLLFGVKYASFF
jgi:hypothetical protein